MRGRASGWRVLAFGGALVGAAATGAAVDGLEGVVGRTLVLIGGLGLGLLAGRWLGRHRREDDARFFEMSNDLLVEASLDGYFVRLSERWEQVLGWTREELMARPFRELVHPDDLAATNVHADALDLAPGEVWNFENRYRRKDGTYRWLLWSARSDDERKYAVARDITERKQLEAERDELLRQLAEVATTDVLTGLPNRRAWEERLPTAVERALQEGRALSVAMVDLDGFKPYNDERGHHAGDLLLRAAATSWRQVLRAGDVLTRYGGDEFAVLLPDGSPAEVQAVLERLRRSTPSGRTCSIGVARLASGGSAAQLVAAADAALYDAKRGGRDRVVAGRR